MFCKPLGLLDLANAYCELRLKQQCEQIIKKGITTDNVAMLYAAAIKFEAKVNTKSVSLSVCGQQCEQIIKKGITTDNVAMLYAAAIKFEAKVNTKFVCLSVANSVNRL